ncbi:MAG: anti-sigma regulatory factor [Actinobacteria bacterium]|nr:anti-sigma regulatory factor [Actinomycetota bacterium]
MDTVSVKIPATPPSLRVVRLITAGLASRLRFTLDEIEDLKIAVDELASYLTGPHGRTGVLEIDFMIYDDHIEISGVGQFSDGQKVRTELNELSQKILETVTDSASLIRDGDVPRFHLSKSRPANASDVDGDG